MKDRGTAHRVATPGGTGEIRGRASAWGVAAVLLVATVVLGAFAGFAFYAPPVGRVATGQEVATETVRRRDRAQVEVAAHMSPQEGRRPTLAEVVEFFALEEDTWSCSVGATWGADAVPRTEQLVRRPLRIGQPVVLCLD